MSLLYSLLGGKQRTPKKSRGEIARKEEGLNHSIEFV